MTIVAAPPPPTAQSVVSTYQAAVVHALDQVNEAIADVKAGRVVARVVSEPSRLAHPIGVVHGGSPS